MPAPARMAASVQKVWPVCCGALPSRLGCGLLNDLYNGGILGYFERLAAECGLDGGLETVVLGGQLIDNGLEIGRAAGDGFARDRAPLDLQ